MRRNNDFQALTTQFFFRYSLDIVSNFFGCCAWRIECGKITLPTIQTLHSFLCAHCLDTNIIYIFLRDTSKQQMEKWIIKRLNEMKKRKEKERERHREKMWFEYKQTNKIEKRQPNTHLIFGSEWNQIGETRERAKHRRTRNVSQRKRIIFQAQLLSILTWILMVFARISSIHSRPSRKELKHKHTLSHTHRTQPATVRHCQLVRWLSVYSPRFLAAVGAICCTLKYNLSPNNFVRSHAKWCNIKTRTRLIFQHGINANENMGWRPAKKYTK